MTWNPAEKSRISINNAWHVEGIPTLQGLQHVYQVLLTSLLGENVQYSNKKTGNHLNERKKRILSRETKKRPFLGS